MNGIITWLDRAMTYGFVTPADDGDDLFFRLDAATRQRLAAPAVGQPVAFAVEAGPEGPEAVRLEPGGAPEPEGF